MYLSSPLYVPVLGVSTNNIAREFGIINHDILHRKGRKGFRNRVTGDTVVTVCSLKSCSFFQSILLRIYVSVGQG